MRQRGSPLWTFAITALALFMVSLDNLVVTMALPVIRRDLGASIADLEWTVNAYTLTFAALLLLGAALGDRFGRRRVFVIGLAIFTRGSAAAALAPSSGAPHPRARGTGTRRRVHHAAEPDDPVRGDLGRSATARARRMGRHLRARDRDRAGRRRRHHPGCLLALDLLAQRADRDRRARRSRSSGFVRAAAPDRSLDLVGVILAALGLVGIVWGVTHGNGRGWTDPQIVGLDRRRVGAPRRLPRLGASHRQADAAAWPVPPTRVGRRQRHLVPDELRDVRLDLPALAVLPGRPGPEPVRGGPACPALDGHAGVRRAARGHRVRPDRRPADPRRRARPDGDRPRAGSRSSARRRFRTPRSCRRSS